MKELKKIIDIFNLVAFCFIALPLGYLFWGFVYAVGGKAVADNLEGLSSINGVKCFVALCLILVGKYYFLSIVKDLKARKNYKRCHRAAVIMVFIYFPVGLYCCAKLNNPKVKALF